MDTHLNNIEDLNSITDIQERKKVIKDYIETIHLEWNGTTKQHTLTMSFKLPLVNDGIGYLKGKTGTYLRDKKGFKKYDVLDGEKELNTPLLCLNSLYGYAFRKVPGLVNFAAPQHRQFIRQEL